MSLNLRLEGTYAGIDRAGLGHHVLENITGDLIRDHLWLNCQRSNFPEGIKIGARVRFFCSTFPRRGGDRYTDCREIEVLT